MGIQAGVGMSFHRNPKVAGQDATRKALAAAGITRPDFVFMFATVGYDQQVLLQAVREATSGAPLCGCSGEGVIVADEADESNFAVAVMTISSDQLRFNHGMVTGLTEDSGHAGRVIAQAIRPAVESDTLALFLFPDGITVNFDRLLNGLEETLCLDRLLPVVGGTASDNLVFERTYQYWDDQVISDGAAWALLSGQAQIAWAVNHSCVPVGVEHKVTRCTANVIFEIDGRPALEVLKDYVTDVGIEEWVMAVLSFPLGLKVAELEADYDEYIIRALVGGKDDATGSVTIPTDVTEGMSIWVTRRDREKLTKGIERAVQDIKAQLGDNPARLVFQFDCAGRGKVFLREQHKLQLLKTLRQQIGPDAPWLGFYTFGELSPVGEHNYFHNYTVVLIVIF